MAKRRVQVEQTSWFEDCKNNEDHPFLAAWNTCTGKPLTDFTVGPNLLSKRMMDSLSSICDTFLPSLDVPSSTKDEDLIEFYGTSASMVGVPEHLGSLLSGVVKHPAIWLIKVALWFLSTWYGTLALCGFASLSPQFPFVQKFSNVRRKKREEILKAWSMSSIILLRMLFKSLKYAISRTYFTQADEKNHNPSWKAIDYSRPNIKAINTQNSLFCPLHASLLHLNSSKDFITTKLLNAGFPTPTISPSSSSLTIHCDAVIIGSGSGGSVVAGLLAKAGYKVIVIDKGNLYHRNQLTNLEGPSVQEMYEGGGLVATNDIGVLVLAGSTIGGGSTINWAASIRTPDHVRREWCDELGLELFGSEAYDHALDVVCERMGVQSKVLDEGLSNMVLRKGCNELGLPVLDVPVNAPPDHYCGWCHLGCRDGKKKSTQETWLVDMAESGNGFIIPGCRALRILHRRVKGKERSVAQGVAVMFGNQEFKVEAKVTVVACGALNTPPLLKRSGLKNRHIGNHLHLHPSVMAWGYFPPSPNDPYNSKKSYEGSIISSMSPSFHTSGYGTLMQTPALHPGMFATITPWISSTDFRERMTKFSRTVHLFSLVRDIGSGNCSRYPSSLTYRLDDKDEEKMKKALEAMVRVLVAAGAVEVGVQHARGERFLVEQGVEELVKGVRERRLKDGRTPVSSAHQMGSCRMGRNAAEGAVSSEGESWEGGGLYLADTSVFPTALGVNPMVTVQAIAYCTGMNVLRMLEGKKDGRKE